MFLFHVQSSLTVLGKGSNLTNDVFLDWKGSQPFTFVMFRLTGVQPVIFSAVPIETLLLIFTGLILKPMQLSDFLNINTWGDSVRKVLFGMLPRRAQIEKVRTEINSGLLKKYGRMTRLEVDKESKTINADLDLKGEKEGIRITLSNYRLIQEGKNPVLEFGVIGASREWLDVLLKTLVKTSVIPERMEVKNLLHQTVIKALL
ncbi:MAG TPA: hypothetical protein VK742_10840 [Candidatus Sulfotelmatobacter sp.]|nr:hypothetical protein [Candidatus Sulfotelmatobacter sp.]